MILFRTNNWQPVPGRVPPGTRSLQMERGLQPASSLPTAPTATPRNATPGIPDLTNMPRQIQSPEKELRFTRSGQAPLFWVAASVLASMVVTILASAVYRGDNPQLPHPAWAIIPLVLAIAAAHTALRLTRHAYLILTPLGLEIFPFFQPSKSMQLVIWQEIAAAEFDADLTLLTLHHNAEQTSGIHLSLAPIRQDRRHLLATAIAGRVAKKSVPPAEP
jgi:hypothetical protein